MPQKVGQGKLPHRLSPRKQCTSRFGENERRFCLQTETGETHTQEMTSTETRCQSMSRPRQSPAAGRHSSPSGRLGVERLRHSKSERQTHGGYTCCEDGQAVSTLFHAPPPETGPAVERKPAHPLSPWIQALKCPAFARNLFAWLAQSVSSPTSTLGNDQALFGAQVDRLHHLTLAGEYADPLASVSLAEDGDRRGGGGFVHGGQDTFLGEPFSERSKSLEHRGASCNLPHSVHLQTARTPLYTIRIHTEYTRRRELQLTRFARP